MGSQNVQGMFTLKDFTLVDVALTGLSNAAVPPAGARLTPAGFAGEVALSTLTAPGGITVNRNGSPASLMVPIGPLIITGNFRTDFGGTVVGGGYTVMVDAAHVAATVQPAGTELDDLVITFAGLELLVPPGSMRITTHIDSSFNDLITEVVNKPDFKAGIIQQLNSQVKAQLGSISAQATLDVRRMVTAQLDGQETGPWC